MQEIIIGKNEAGQRFDKYLHKYFKEAPGSFIYKMLRKKNIELNGKKASGNEKLVEGDSIKLFMSEETIEKFKGSAVNVPVQKHSLNNSFDIRKNIIYENEDILLLNKPAGVLSQKSVPQDVSVNEMIIDYLLAEKKLTENELETFKPSVCNRLDRNTTGLITFGKTLKGIQELSLGFKERIFDKYYLAAVWGNIEKDALIDGYLKKDSKSNKVSISKTPSEDGESSYIKTYYEPVAHGMISDNNKNYPVTLLRIKLITGKTHQIRAHLASINHGIMGDDKYGNRSRNEYLKKAYKIKYQLLHSYELTFNYDDRLDALNKLAGETVKCPPHKIYEQLFDWR